MYQLINNKRNSKKGMTMAEMLITISIVIILAGVAFIAVVRYQRSMAQLERDNIAKEIFVAAQNHLTEARGENYLSADLLRILESTEADDEALAETAAGTKYTDDEGTSYYIVVNRGRVAGGKGQFIFDQMLPFAAVEENIRAGGNYVIRYQPAVGKILEVFYCSAGDKFGHTFSLTESPTLFSDYSGAGKKGDRIDYTNSHAVLGWYGGEELEELGVLIEPPEITIENGNMLKVISKDYNERTSANGIELRLIIKGKISGAKKCLEADEAVALLGNKPNTDTFILDDITNKGDTDRHFGTRFQKTEDTLENPDAYFIPGEDLEIRAITYSNTMLANIAESAIGETNSLFASLSDGSEKDSSYTLTEGTITITNNPGSRESSGRTHTAYIECIRHLENLDARVSNLDAHDDGNLLNVIEAVQTEDLYWGPNSKGKKNFVEDAGYSVYYSTGTGTSYAPSANNTAGTSANGGRYRPVDLPAGFSCYDGRRKDVVGINVVTTADDGNAGMFGSTPQCTVKDLRLVNFDIQSTKACAGTLIGSMAGATVSNVIALYEPDSTGAINVKPVTGVTAGGLVGRAIGGTIEYSAAAMAVSGTNIAGGLVGEAYDEATINCCYSAGQTEKGEYYTGHGGNDGVTRSANATEKYNITATGTAGIAGGFIGSVGDSSITNSYTTCSASGAIAGGFAGSSGNDYGTGSIKNSYCTGLVSGSLTVSQDGKTRSGDNAFIGSGSPAVENDSYYSVVNDKQMKDNNNKVISVEYKLSGMTTTDSNGVIIDDADIMPFDRETDKFKEFTARGVKAHPYDSFLETNYNNGGTDTLYYLKTVDELAGNTGNDTCAAKGYFVAEHYGDWPAPELFIVNN